MKKSIRICAVLLSSLLIQGSVWAGDEDKKSDKEDKETVANKTTTALRQLGDRVGELGSGVEAERKKALKKIKGKKKKKKEEKEEE